MRHIDAFQKSVSFQKRNIMWMLPWFFVCLTFVLVSKYGRSCLYYQKMGTRSILSIHYVKQSIYHFIEWTLADRLSRAKLIFENSEEELRRISAEVGKDQFTVFALRRYNVLLLRRSKILSMRLKRYFQCKPTAFLRNQLHWRSSKLPL